MVIIALKYFAKDDFVIDMEYNPAQLTFIS